MATAAIVIGCLVAGALVATAMFSSVNPNAGNQKPQDIDFSTNKYGIPIPEVLGTVKIAGNYIYAGGQRSKAIKESSGGKGGGGGEVVTGYKYYMTFALGICMGPVDTIYSVFDNEDLLWAGELKRPASGVASVSAGNLGTITFYFGTDNQEPSAKLGARLADSTLNTPCRGMCWAYFDDVFIGKSPTVPTFRFVVKRCPTYAFAGNETISSYDYNAAHAIWHILTTMTGLPASWLNAASFAAVATTLAGEDRGISMVFAEQQAALDYIDNVLSHVLGMLRFNSDGTFHLALARNDYDEATLPVVTEDMCAEMPSIKRSSWIDTTNEIKAEYNERVYSNATKPTVLYFCFIDESENSYFTIDTLGITYLLMATPRWGADYNNAKAYISDLKTYANYHGVIFNVRISGYDPFDQESGCKNALCPFNNTYETAGGPLGWPDFAGSQEDCFRPPTLEYLKTTFINALPGGLSLSSKVYVVISCDNSGSMTPATLGSAYTEWKQWITEAYPSFIMVPHEEARSDERWLSWLVQDIDVSPDGANYRTGISNPSAVNIANQKIQGRVESETLSLKLFTKNKNAVWATQEALRKKSFPTATLNAKLNRDAFRLQPGDVFKFTFAPYGIESMVFRLARVDEEDLESESITITAEEEYTALSEVCAVPPDPEDLSSPATSYAVGGDWVSTSQAATVEGEEPVMLGVTGVQQVAVYSAGGAEYVEGTDFEVDRTNGSLTLLPEGGIADGDILNITFSAQETITRRFLELPHAFSGEVIQFLPLVTRPNSVNVGFEIHFSTDNETYSFLTVEDMFAVKGELFRDYPRTFQIDDDLGMLITFLGPDVGDIESITRTELLGKRNLALIGDELVTFQNIEPVFGRTYRLSGVYRGRFTTEMAEHSRGDAFLYIGESPADPLIHSELTPGSTRYFKAVEYNPINSEDISMVPAVPVTVLGRAYAPYPPCNVLANGEGLHPEYSEGITLEWDARLRGSGAGLRPPENPDTAPVREGMFRVKIYDGTILKLTVSSILTYGSEISQAALAGAGCHGHDLTAEVTGYLLKDLVEYESEPVSVTVYYDGGEG